MVTIKRIKQVIYWPNFMSSRRRRIFNKIHKINTFMLLCKIQVLIHQYNKDNMLYRSTYRSSTLNFIK